MLLPNESQKGLFKSTYVESSGIRCYEKCGFSKRGMVCLTNEESGEKRIFLMSLDRDEYIRRFGGFTAESLIR